MNATPKTKSSSAIARLYGVSAKTVRDIWCGRTWHRQTMHLDPMRPLRPPARKGRPPGSKDLTPRRRQQAKGQPHFHFLVEADGEAQNHNLIGLAGGLIAAPLIALCSDEDMTDPFHADWPHWERADRFAAPPAAAAVGLDEREDVHSFELAKSAQRRVDRARNDGERIVSRR